MAEINDVRTVLSSLLKAPQVEKRALKDSENYNAEDGFDNDDPLTLSDLYRDENGNRLPSNIPVFPLFGRPILPSQISTIQLDLDWLNVISQVIASSHHTFAMFAVSEDRIKGNNKLSIKDFPKTGTLVRLLSARTGPDEIDIVCEGIQRVSVVKVIDSKKNIVKVRYPEIEYRLAHPSLTDELNTNNIDLRHSLQVSADFEKKLRNLIKEQKKYAASIGIDIEPNNNTLQVDFSFHNDEHTFGTISKAKFDLFLKFVHLDHISQKEKDQLLRYIASPTPVELVKLKEYFNEIEELINSRRQTLEKELDKLDPKAKEVMQSVLDNFSKTLNKDPNHPKLPELAPVDSNSTHETSEERLATEETENHVAQDDKFNPKQQAILDFIKSSFEQDQQTIEKKKLCSLDINQLLRCQNPVLDESLNGEVAEHLAKFLNEDNSKDLPFDLLEKIKELDREELRKATQAKEEHEQQLIKDALSESPEDDSKVVGSTGPNIGFVNEDTSVVTFMPGEESSEDLLLRLTNLQKQHEQILNKKAKEVKKNKKKGKEVSTDEDFISTHQSKVKDKAKKQTAQDEQNEEDAEDLSYNLTIDTDDDLSGENLADNIKGLIDVLDQDKDIQLSKDNKWSVLQRTALIRSKLAELLGGKVVFGLSNLNKNQKDAPREVEIRAYCLGITSALQELLPLNPMITDDMRQYLSRFDMSNPSVLADCSSSITQAEYSELQKVLDTIPILPRLKLAFELISRDLSAAKLQDKIKMQVAERLQKRQKEFFLREQLNEIKKELGLSADEKSLDIEKFKTRMSKLNPPKHIQERFDDEISKLSMLEPSSPEYATTRNYVDVLSSIPWGKMSKEKFDLAKARKILNEDHEGLQDVKERIIEFLAVGALKGETRGQIMLFVGPPGVGKTSIGKSIAKALNRPFYRLSLGGIDDVAEIKGHRKTYIGAMPGKLISALRETKVMNPVIMLDEIDKLGKSYRGDPDSALLETLDPEQNKNFMDMYLDEKLDLSQCLFICTANSTDTLSAPLLDRMDPIRLSGYIAREKFAIAKNHLLPRAYHDAGIKPKSKLVISDDTLMSLIEGYARESGVRTLERSIAKLIRKAAVKLVEGEKKIVISTEDLEKYLGDAPFKKEKMLHGVGIMTGLAWTASGGVTLPIESIVTNRDAKSLNLTGSLGDVMKESANIAYSFVQSHLDKYSAKKGSNFFKKAAIHVHVPEGATPKDGPSAGVTMATSLLSLALNTPPKEGYAMTGELTLSGHVLPIGGLREKVIAARRMGIFNLIIPIGNEGDVKELPEQVSEGVTFYYADTYDDVAYILFDEAKESLISAYKEQHKDAKTVEIGPRSKTFLPREEDKESKEPKKSLKKATKTKA